MVDRSYSNERNVMSEGEEKSLEERVARLERLVAELHRAVVGAGGVEVWGRGHGGDGVGADGRTASAAAWHGGGPGEVGSRGGVPAGGGGRAAMDGGAPGRDWTAFGEGMLGRAGIALLFLGLVYLFKLAVDEGWVTPAIRVASGVALGTTLIAFGAYLHSSRRLYSQILMGGGLAALYLSGTAAHRLYELIPADAAVGFLVAITGFAFWLALRQDNAVLSSLAATGGFTTPVALGTRDSPEALAAYATLLILWTGAVYLRRSWRPLLRTSVLVGTILLAFGTELFNTSVAMAGAGIVYWVAYGLAPTLAAVRRASDDPWQAGLEAFVLRVGTSIATVVFISLSIAASDTAVSILLAVPGFVFAGIAATGTVQPVRQGTAVAAPVLLTIAAMVGLADAPLSIALTVIAVGCHLAWERLGSRALRHIGHILFVGIGIWLVMEAVDDHNLRFLDGVATGLLVATIAAGWTARYLPDNERGVRLIATHIALMVWLAMEFGPLGGRGALITVAWAVQGATVLLLGLRSTDRMTRWVGLATLGAVAAKLVLIDTARVEMVWRILLLMGCGAAFLGLAYVVRSAESRTETTRDRDRQTVEETG